MAVFWKYIKGLQQADNQDLYTYIEMPTQASNIWTLPQLKVNTANSYSDATLLGNILIDDSYSGYSPTFSQGIKDLTISKSTLKNVYIVGSSDSDATVLWKQPSSAINGIEIQVPIVFDQKITMQTSLHVEETIEAKEATFSSAVNAGYFNATSDRRLKENIQSFDTAQAYKIVLDTPLYQFDYKLNHMPSVGVMAQDLTSYQFGSFNFVDNIDSIGTVEDHMSVHESKLIYLLWGAIQEQQKEIELLKQKLNK